MLNQLFHKIIKIMINTNFKLNSIILETLIMFSLMNNFSINCKENKHQDLMNNQNHFKISKSKK
jgi:hypothetical protein